jgi:hypothetical protein
MIPKSIQPSSSRLSVPTETQPATRKAVSVEGQPADAKRPTRRVEKDFIDRGPYLPQSGPTSLLPPAETWRLHQSAGWYANAPVWWVRRLISGQRNADRDSVLQFLQDKKLLDNEGRAIPISANGLVRLSIKKQFWWISQAQVNSLARWLLEEAKNDARPARSDDALKAYIYDRLFN